MGGGEICDLYVVLQIFFQGSEMSGVVDLCLILERKKIDAFRKEMQMGCYHRSHECCVVNILLFPERASMV